MKTIWSILFLACGAAAFGIAWLLFPESARGEKFWLSLSGIGLGLLLTYFSIVMRKGPQGEQGRELMHGQMFTGSVLYLCLAVVLALIAMTAIGFKFLLVLHILALLVWIIIVALGAIGATAMSNADKQ
jgi:hypothetical protein